MWSQERGWQETTVTTKASEERVRKGCTFLGPFSWSMGTDVLLSLVQGHVSSRSTSHAAYTFTLPKEAEPQQVGVLEGL